MLSQNVTKDINAIELEIDELLIHNHELKQKIDNVQTIPGIGKLAAVAFESKLN